MTTQPSAPRLHSLVICIGNYRSQGIPKLPGAVKDQGIVANFLRSKSSTCHRTFLTDSDATRLNIIQAFKDLSTDDNISFNEPILIHFSGHGATLVPVSSATQETSSIVGIVPYDFHSNLQGGKLPIPNYTLSALLHRLSERKGKNIVGGFLFSP
jgi:hypothetical protein